MTAPADLWVDCSDNNDTPDLKAYAKAGHTKISFKRSQGTGYHWPQSAGLADQAHDLGLRVQHYHWLTPNQSALSQADYFLSLLDGHLGPDDDLMTDFEATAGLSDPADAVRAQQLATFNDNVRKERATTPLCVYTGNWYLDSKPHCQDECRSWDITMSDYSGASVLPNPYGLHYVAWQFSQTARVPGFAGQVDYNRSLVPEDDMSAADVAAINAHTDQQIATLRAQLTNIPTEVWERILEAPAGGKYPASSFLVADAVHTDAATGQLTTLVKDVAALLKDEQSKPAAE